MKRVLFILFLFVSIKGFPQQYADKDYYLIDSLVLDELSESDKQLLEIALKEYHNTTSDTTRINAISGICDNLIHESWKRYQMFQLAYVEKVMDKNIPAYEEHLKENYAAVLNNLAIIAEENGNLPKAIELQEKSLALQRELNKPAGIALSLGYLGIVYSRYGNYKKALGYYHESLKIREQLVEDNPNDENKVSLATSYNNIGQLHQQQKNSKLAIEYYTKSYEINKEVNELSSLANNLNNLGTVYQNQKAYDKARENYFEALIINRSLKDLGAMELNYFNIGNSYYSVDNYDQAITYLDSSLVIAKQLNNPQAMCRTYNALGQCYFYTGQRKKGRELLIQSLELAQQMHIPRLVEMAADVLADIYTAENNYEKAFETYKLYIVMRDSLFNEESQKAAFEQQAKYEYEKQKAVDDAEHEKLLAIEQESKEKQQILTYATAGGLGLVGIFLLFVFNRLKVTRKQKGMIEEAHSELEEKNQEILDSIQYAKRIQSAILPPNKVVKEYLEDSFILYLPKDIVAGDFYWLETVDNKVLFAAADCTGHGVPGAMVSVVCNNGLNRSVREHGLTEPGKILDKTRDIVVQEFEKSEDEVKDGMDIALCSLSGNLLEYAGAHNPLWIIRKGSDEIEEIKANKQPIGKSEHPLPYTTHKVELEKGDTIYIFSDGYADQFGGEKGKKLKTINFKKLLLSIKDESIDKQRELIHEAFEEWKGNLEQLDDICVIGVRI